MSPLDFGDHDPVVSARETIMTNATITVTTPANDSRAAMEEQVYLEWAPPRDFTEEDTLRTFYHMLCNVDLFRTEYCNSLKTYSERYGKKMKKGYETDAAILKLYDDKLIGELTAVHDAGLMDDEDFARYKGYAEETVPPSEAEIRAGGRPG